MQPLGCSTCGKPVFYVRKYSGESLCISCFTKSIEEKVRKTISKYRMLEHGDKVAVAVSGGKDSLSLLHILAKILPKHSSELIAVTIDEGIEGYRDESVTNAEEVARKVGVPLHIFSYKELYGFTQDEAMARRRIRITSCAMCGTLRRRALDLATERLGVNVLATAHNLDDMVQTFMINIMNGDIKRLGWLGGISNSSRFKTRRIHPFMEVYEKEAALYAFANSLPMQSTHCPYMNEGIRSSIRVYLNEVEESHPGIKHMMLKSALGIAGRLSKYGTKASKCTSCGLPSSSELCSACTLRLALQPLTIAEETNLA